MSPDRFLAVIRRLPPGLGLLRDADLVALADGLEDRLNESALTSTERLRTRALVAQCLASGRVGRDELRSIGETLPRVIWTLRRIPNGALSNAALMAQAGQGLITGRALAAAIAKPSAPEPVERRAPVYCPPMPAKGRGPVAECLARGLRAFSGGLRKLRP